MKGFLKNKAFGFYVTCLITLLSFIASISYIVAYAGTDYISWIAFFSLVAVVVANVLLIIKKKFGFAQAASAVLVGVAFIFFIYGLYLYMSVVMVGIDAASFSSSFTTNIMLLVLLSLLSFINIFLKQEKDAIKRIKGWRKVLVFLTSFTFGFLVLVTTIAIDNQGMISAIFQSDTFKVINRSTDDETIYYESAFSNLEDLIAADKEACQQAEAEGIVLLKNENNALPLTGSDRNVSLFSVTSVDPVYGGTGSGAVNTSTAPTFKTAFESAGITVNPDLWNFYSENLETYGRVKLGGFMGADFTIGDAPWNVVEENAGSSFTTYGDAAIFVIGRVGGEGTDMKATGMSDETATEGDYLRLSQNEIDVLENLNDLKGTTFDRIIVLINSANPLETEFINNPDYGIDAALWIGGVGQEGLYAVADILTGDITPSGHLSDTFWNDYSDNPVHANFGVYTYDNAEEMGVEKSSYKNYVVYQEGVYLGYRYAETRYEDIVMGTPNAGEFDYEEVISYTFGYGLSYTTFEYSNYNVSKDGRTYTVSVTVTNTGDTYSGKEVAQIYVQKPYTQYDIDNSIEKPSVELVGYAKTDVLAPGESQTLTIEVDERYFTSYDAHNAETYILDQGTYYLAVGNNAHDALNNILDAKGYTTADGMDYDGDDSLVATFDLGFDDTTYSTSDATGVAISNLFDDADMNLYDEAGDNAIIYISRNNWNATVDLDNEVLLSLTQGMVDDLYDQTASLIPDDIAYPNYGIDAGLSLIDMRADEFGNEIAFDDPLWDTFMDQLTWDEITYLISTGLRKTGTIASIAKPETVDHNGPSGLTQKYSYGPLGLASITDDPLKDTTPMCYPSNGVIAATFNNELALRIGDLIGEDALWAGYQGLYGTGANIHRSAYEGRAFEYYSEDPVLSGQIVAYETLGMQSHGMYVYLKHFALNDQENNRVGIATFTNEQALREIYLKAFEIPIVDGGAQNVMSAFNRVGLTASPNSKALLTDFLRGECGMTGFVVTDMYISYDGTVNRISSLMAGNDLPDSDLDGEMIYEDYTEGYGELAQAMRLSAKRILYTVVHSNAMNGFDSDTEIEEVTPGWITTLTIIDIVQGCIAVAASSLVILPLLKKKNQNN